MNLVKLLLIGLTTIALTACSRTIQWEEEVLLNTGETIVVERSVLWRLEGGSGAGNIADFAMRPQTDQQIYAFSYRGKDYRYSGGADVGWIAISPTTKNPTLVAASVSLGWQTNNNYFCVTPQYVQLTPLPGGEQWIWPEKIETWLYDLPANVMVNIPKPEEKRSPRYSTRDRDQRDAVYRLQSPGGARIDPAYKTTCITDGTKYMNQNRTTK